MKERSIIARGWEVRALLDGRKTRWTVPVVPQLPPIEDFTNHHDVSSTYFDAYNGGPQWCFWNKQNQVRNDVQGDVLNSCMWRCPFGVPGDRLYVRETFQPLWTEPLDEDADRNWETGKGYVISYPATDGVIEFYHEDKGPCSDCMPSVHMPRWASRIHLGVTGVSVGRVQDVTPSEAIREGLTSDTLQGYIMAFVKHWDSRWPKYPWADNPWVWTGEVKVAEQVKA